MALVARIIARCDEDVDASELANVRADLALFAERLGVDANNGLHIAAPNVRDANGLRDLMLARLRRFGLSAPAKVSEHNCPHVAGYEEAVIGPCNAPEYGLTETVV